MPRLAIDYSNAVIYKLSCKDKNITELYIGSTTNFTVRKNQHKLACSNIKNVKNNCKKYQFIRQNGGWNNWEMIEVETFPCKTGRELTKRKEELRCKYDASLNTNKCWSDGRSKVKCK